MSRKLVLVCSFLAAVIVVAIGWFVYRLFSEKGQVPVALPSDFSTEALCAVPMDAIVIYRVKSYSDDKDLVGALSSEYVSILSSFQNGGEGISGTVSIHPIGKNILSALMICVVPEGVDEGDFLKCVLGKCAGVVQKRYDASVIHCSSSPGLNFAVFGKFFLCSSSLTLLESSLRMLENGESLMDNDIFVEAIRNGFGGESVTVSHNSIGKLISCVARSPYRRYSPFLSHIADWSSFNLDFSREGEISGTGVFACRDSKSCYYSIFEGQRGVKSELTDILPFNTMCCTDLRISDLEPFITAYGNFRYSLGRRQQQNEKQMSLARSAGIREIAKVTIEPSGVTEPLIFVQLDRTEVLCPTDAEVSVCDNTFLPSAVGGDFFSLPDSAFSARVFEGWVVAGSKNDVEWYVNTFRNVNFFSLSEWLVQTPVKAAPGRNTVLSSMVNISLLSDSLPVILGEKYAEQVHSLLTDRNFNYFTFSVNVEGGGIVPHFTLYSSNLERMPSPKNAGIAFGEEVDSFLIQVPRGPFEVKDFRNGKRNTLEQLGDGRLRLKDDKGREVWTVSHTGTICGSVSQIDYLKNDKLQMLFASGSKLYLLTRLGGAVNPFPVETGKEIRLGPKVFDFSSDREYLLAVLHMDNTVVFYDRNGELAAGYHPLSLEATITDIPEPIKMGQLIYWIVRTPRQTFIMNAEGALVANFSRRHRLAPNTEVIIKSSDEVQVSGMDGNTYLLKMSTGEFTKQ